MVSNRDMDVGFSSLRDVIALDDICKLAIFWWQLFSRNKVIFQNEDISCFKVIALIRKFIKD